MTPQKLAKAFVLAKISIPSAREHIERNMSAHHSALAGLTSKQLAAVIGIHHKAFFDGRASCKAECLDGNINDGLYWLGGSTDGVAVKMLKGIPSLQ